MKYSESNPPLKMPMTQSTWYRNTIRQKPIGIVWHSFDSNDNENAYLKRFCQPDDNVINKDRWLCILGINEKGDDWNHRNNEAGFNCWIGKLGDGSVASLQVSPWNFRAWGRGGNSRHYSCNDGWIQICICEDRLRNPAYFELAYKEACELSAYLCRKFKIDPNGLSINGSSVLPNVTCDADAYTFGACTEFGYLKDWLSENGKDMATARNDIIQLIETAVDEDVTFSSDDISNVTQCITENNIESNSDNIAIPSEEADDQNGDVIADSNSTEITEAELTSSECQEPTEESTTHCTDRNDKSELCENLLGISDESIFDCMLEQPSNTGVKIRAVKKPADRKTNHKPTIKKPVKKSPIRELTNVVVPETNIAQEEKLYLVRKSAYDIVSQKGAYKHFKTAMNMADDFADEGYKVFDMNNELIYIPPLFVNSDKQQKGTDAYYQSGKLYGQQTAAKFANDSIAENVAFCDDDDDESNYTKNTTESTTNVVKLSFLDKIYNFIISIINKIFKK